MYYLCARIFICGPVGQTLNRINYTNNNYDAAKTRVIIYVPLLIGRICFGDQNTIATAISQAMKSSRHIRTLGAVYTHARLYMCQGPHFIVDDHLPHVDCFGTTHNFIAPLFNSVQG